MAGLLVILAALGFAFGIWYGKDLKIGDLDAGAPELRADSRYNLDNQFMVDNYSASTDVFVVMVKTPDLKCVTYQAYAAVDLFEWVMADVPGVQSTFSLVNASKRIIAGNNEGSPKWATVTRNQWVLNGSVSGKEIPPGSLVMGSPGKVVRELDEAAREGILRSAEGYRQKMRLFREGLVAIG